MPWTDPIDARFRDNPIYGLERGRRGGVAVATGIFAYATLGLVYLGLALIARDALLFRSTLGGFALILPLSAMTLLCSLWPPAVTAVWLAAERERGTLGQILVAPYSTRQILRGAAAARLRPMLHMLGLSLPAFLAAGVLLSFTNSEAVTGSGHLLGMAIAVGIGALAWLWCAMSFRYGAIVGLWASLQSGSVGGALALAYLVVLGAGWVLGLMCGLVPLVVYLVVPGYLFEATVKSLDALEDRT